ncbi:MAG: hypothetical protein ACT4PK_04085, partial [Gammaproteobacteria bacterium]
MSRSRFARALVAVAAVVLLTSCSTLKFAYNRADWFGSWEFGKYVELEGAAEEAFDTGFDALWRWHRGTQLEVYASDLREIAEAARGPLTREQVDGYFKRASAHGRRLLEEALPPLARVLAALDD